MGRRTLASHDAIELHRRPDEDLKIPPFAIRCGAWCNQLLDAGSRSAPSSRSRSSAWPPEPLEDLVATTIARELHVERWEVFSKLDAVLQDITAGGEQRLAWQAR